MTLKFRGVLTEFSHIFGPDGLKNTSLYQGCELERALSMGTVLFVLSLHHVQLFVTPWTAAHQASMSFTLSQSLLKLMSTESKTVGRAKDRRGVKEPQRA